MADQIALMREGEMPVPVDLPRLHGMEPDRDLALSPPAVRQQDSALQRGVPGRPGHRGRHGPDREREDIWKPGNSSRRRTRSPAVCGRVCYHPCESSCNRGEFDDPVSINALERFMADMASKHGRRVDLEKGETDGESGRHRFRTGGADLRLSP